MAPQQTPPPRKSNCKSIALWGLIISFLVCVFGVIGWGTGYQSALDNLGVAKANLQLLNESIILANATLAETIENDWENHCLDFFKVSSPQVLYRLGLQSSP